MSDDISPENRPLAGRDLANAQWGKPSPDQGHKTPVLERYKPRSPEDIARSLKGWGANEQIIGKYLESAETAEMVRDAVGALEVSQEKGANERFMTRDQADNVYKLFGWGSMNSMIPEELRREKQEVEQMYADFVNKIKSSSGTTFERGTF